MKLLPALVIANTLQWSFGKLNRIERRQAREIKEYQPNSPIVESSTSTTHEEDSGRDVGVLYANAKAYEEDDTLLFDESRSLKSESIFGENTLEYKPQVCNPNKVVNCDYGYNVGNSTQTCQDACEGECCFNPDNPDDNSCAFFTGSVCKDGISCVGDKACYAANITSIVRSCKGESACRFAGFGGSIEKIVDSCQDTRACQLAALYGSIGSIVNSCKGNELYEPQTGYSSGEDSCLEAAYGGHIGSIVDSCYYYDACGKVASRGGYVESIVNSCQYYEACENLARNKGSVGSIVNSCQGYGSCQGAAFGGFSELQGTGCSIKSIVNSCNSAFDTCGGLAAACISRSRETYCKAGHVGHIFKSCLGVGIGRYGLRVEKTCKGMGSYGGSVEGVFKSCNGEGACENVAKGGGSIGGVGIFKACNAKDACQASYITSNPYITNVLQEIPEGIKLCCNEEGLCLNNTTLPEDCKK